MSQLDLLATSAFGLEAVVADEVERLGYNPRVVQPGRVLFVAHERGIARANLWLRTSDRVLLRVGTFPATDFGELFDRTFALPWHEWLAADATFPVTGRSHKSQLSSVPACQKIVKKAIVEKLRSAHGVEILPETGPRYKIDVALLDNEATLTIDTSGAGLHKRGYRTLTGAAPLKETLAAALVQLAHWRPEQPLIDPFCGSGTIPIEAALLGRNLAPGRRRTFDAEAWPALDARLWEEARSEARDLALPAVPVRIIGTDRDANVLSLARYHAQQAEVPEDVHFQNKEFRDLTSKRQYGMVITNPPYGQRLGERTEAEAICRLLPDVLRRLPTWSHFILSAQPDFEALVGQSATRRRKLYNGRIQCTYFQFYGPRPRRRGDRRAADGDNDSGPEQVDSVGPSVIQSDNALLPVDALPPEDLSAGEPELVATLETAEAEAIGVPKSKGSPQAAVVKQAFGGLPDRAADQAELFRSRLLKLARHLRRWPTKQGITCYRLYERDIPEVPLVVDRYEDYLHIAEFERPNEHTPAQHEDWIHLMLKTAADALQVPRANVFFKRRQRQSGCEQYERQGTERQTALAHEGGLNFEVNLSDYLDTGLFLDHRVTRAMVRDAAKGKRFLNLFCYSGAFSVYAAAGGAASTVSVDLSNTYLDWAQRNLTLNHFTGPEHQLLRGDIMPFLRAHPPGPHYDLAVADPPTYSNSKMTAEDWDVQRDYVELLDRLLKLMTPGGIVFFSTNFRRFKFEEDRVPLSTIREISRQTVPPDFRNRRVHRCWRLVRTPS